MSVRSGLRVVTLVACLAGTSVIAACSSADHSAPTLGDVRALLARQGAAVLHHNRTAFAAGLDSASQASAFRARELSAFANVERLPLASWAYRIEGRTDAHDAEAAQSRRFGTGAIIVRVALRYALRGVDRIPTSHDLWWTFVRHDGHVVVAADDALANSGGVSWRGPWDFGRLVVVRGPHSLVLGHPDNAAALSQVDATVEAAVPVVTAVWGTDWSQYVAVVVPSSSAELTAESGESSDVTLDIAAGAVSDGQDPLSGDPYGQRLIINPGALARLSRIGQQITIRHEITHLADARYTTAATPEWLIEGFPEYVANLDSGQPVQVTASELAADVRRGKVPAALPAPDAFATAGQAAQAYEGAWLACRLIAARIGQAGLVQFYRAVGRSTAGPDAAAAAALRSALHEDLAAFTAQWRSYLKAQLGK